MVRGGVLQESKRLVRGISKVDIVTSTHNHNPTEGTCDATFQVHN